MFYEKFEIILALFAGVVASIVSYIVGTELYELSIRIIIVIISFYFIGLFIKMFLSVGKNKDDLNIIEEIPEEEHEDNLVKESIDSKGL